MRVQSISPEINWFLTQNQMQENKVHFTPCSCLSWSVPTERLQNSWPLPWWLCKCHSPWVRDKPVQIGSVAHPARIPQSSGGNGTGHNICPWTPFLQPCYWWEDKLLFSWGYHLVKQGRIGIGRRSTALLLLDHEHSLPGISQSLGHKDFCKIWHGLRFHFGTNKILILIHYFKKNANPGLIYKPLSCLIGGDTIYVSYCDYLEGTPTIY